MLGSRQGSGDSGGDYQRERPAQSAGVASRPQASSSSSSSSSASNSGLGDFEDDIPF